MSFDCMNINNSFLDILGLKNSPGLIAGLNDFSKGEVLFKDMFTSILQGKQLPAEDLKGSNAILDKIVLFVSQELNGLKGEEFLNKLKQFMMMFSSNDLSNLTISEQGLDVLKELFLSAGYEMGQINELMDDLKLQMEKGGKTFSLKDLGELMDKLAQLDRQNDIPDDMQDQEQESILPISALAFIETIMISLGIPENARNTILSDVKTDQGIDLNTLIKNFKEFEKKSFASQTFFKTDPGNNSVVKLINQLNLGDNSRAFMDGQLSLTDFIHALENKKKQALGKNKEYSLQNILAEVADPKKTIVKEYSLQNILAEVADPKKRGVLSVLNSAETDGKNRVSGLFDAFSKKRDNSIDSSLSVKIDPGTADVNMEKSGKDLSGLIDKLLNNIDKQINIDEKIVNVPLNKLSSQDFEKFFGFFSKGGDGSEDHTTLKSGLEEKFVKLLGKLELNMDGKSGSESKNSFQKRKQQSGGLKLSDITQSTSGEDKLLNSVRYLSSSKKNQVRTLPSYVTNQIGRSIVRAVNKGQTELNIQLKPPELGRMMITIEDLGNSIRVSVVAENQAAKDILLSNSNSLKAALAGSGINLENFDVDLGSNFNRSMADAKNQSWDFKGRKNSKNESLSEEDMMVEKQTLLQKQYLTHDGVLYYVA